MTHFYSVTCSATPLKARARPGSGHARPARHSPLAGYTCVASPEPSGQLCYVYRFSPDGVCYVYVIRTLLCYVVVDLNVWGLLTATLVHLRFLVAPTSV
jgi:hypothetical protein